MTLITFVKSLPSSYISAGRCVRAGVQENRRVGQPRVLPIVGRVGGQCPSIACAQTWWRRVLLFALIIMVSEWPCLKLILYEICMFNTQASLLLPGQLLDVRDCFSLSNREDDNDSQWEIRPERGRAVSSRENPTVANRYVKRRTTSAAMRRQRKTTVRRTHSHHVRTTCKIWWRKCWQRWWETGNFVYYTEEYKCSRLCRAIQPHPAQLKMRTLFDLQVLNLYVP